MPQRTILRVPYKEKDQCKRLGGKWDAALRKWYVPAGEDPTPFERWLPGNHRSTAISDNPPPEVAATTQNYLPNHAFMETMDEERVELTKDKFEAMRTRLLDLTRRNRLINCPLYGRRTQLIRVVDEIPDLLFQELRDEKLFELSSLPQLDDDPADENTAEFEFAFAQAQIIDEEYNEGLDAIVPSEEGVEDSQRALIRALKDRVRQKLNMPPRPRGTTAQSLVVHATQNGIEPSYDLPEPDAIHDDGRHQDEKIQTLLLPKDLERISQRVLSKYQSYMDETGINIMQGAFGFLEWQESESSDKKLFSPLVLLPLIINKKVMFYCSSCIFFNLPQLPTI